MRIIRSFNNCTLEYTSAVVAIGNFDGVHAGHREVLAAARAQATSLNAPLAVMTFYPHPRMYFKPGEPSLRITTLAEKLRLLKAEGVDIVYLVRFNAAFAALTAEAFMRDILVQALKVRHVVTGGNFTFGKNRGGNAQSLRDYGAAHGFGTTQVPPIRGEDGEICSSSRIRSLLSQGSVHHVARMLERPYSLYGTVVHGDARGRSIGFPTANIALPATLFLPRFGVYAVRVSLQSGELLPAVANLGTRPTVEGAGTRLEVHIPHWSGDLYGQKTRVHFHRFLRPEQKFESIDALKAQIAKDCVEAATFATLADL